jgi:hypothetical protein
MKYALQVRKYPKYMAANLELGCTTDNPHTLCAAFPHLFSRPRRAYLVVGQ